MNLFKYYLYSLALFSCIPLTTFSYDNAHFYRATNNFFFQTVVDKNWLSEIDITFGGGSTRHSRIKESRKAPLFDIYGLNNMHDLGNGVPGKDLTNPADLILTQLSLIPTRDCFAQFSIDGRFALIEANFFYLQHLACGFFFFSHIPLRRFKITDICIKDCSPTDAPFPNINTPIWQSFLAALPFILSKYSLSTEPINATGVGDLSLILGWTYNYNESSLLDFVDLSLSAGVLLPTGKKKNVDKLFSLPFGYDGHVGVPWNADVAFGLCEWLVLGAHFDAITFISHSQEKRFETSLFQKGIINLAKDCVTVQQGTVWNGSAYVKADHFLRGISLLFGYSFSRQDRTKYTNCDNCFMVNNNALELRGWKMRTLHIALDIDMTQPEQLTGLHFGAFYNQVVGGERIFDTNMAGGTIGLDLDLSF